MPFILASASPRRLSLLKQAGFMPAQVFSPEIDESHIKTELPRDYALRMAREKAAVAQAQFPNDICLSADTVVAVGRRILPKAETEAQARACIALLSGRTHRVYTAIAVASVKGIQTRCVETRLKFKRLSHGEIETYIASGEWQGKAGGYAIQGMAEKFCTQLIGSYSAVVGLPLYETTCLLESVI